MVYLRKLLIISWLVLPLLQGQADGIPRVINIGLITDSSTPSLDRIRSAVETEILELMNDEFDIHFSDRQGLTANWSLEGVKKAVDSAISDPKIDIVVGLGVLASNELSQRKNFSKPVFAPFVMNVELQGLPLNQGVSGVDNLNYLTFPTNLERDISLFKEMVPFNRLSILLNGYFLSAIPNLPKIVNEMVQGTDVEIELVPVWDSSIDALNRMSPSAEAAFVLTLTQLNDEELKRLADGLIERKIPSFTMFSQRYLEQGFLASMSPDTDLPRLLRRLALNIQRVVLGENAGELEVNVSESDQLAINMQTAKKLGISPPWHFMQEAVLVNAEDIEPEGLLTLKDAVERGLACNVSLAASEKVLVIGREEVNKVRSNLLPQVKVSGSYTRIDKDRAANAFGIFPEKAVWGRAGLSQVIYSNRLMGDLCVERQLQRARCHGYEVNKLDCILSISQTYLNLLRAQTIERIQRTNLDRTRTHLKLARQRVDVGVARSSEVYRWESQFASDLTQVTSANYQTKSTETALKRLLNVPQEERVMVEEVSLDAPYWAKKKEWLEENVDNDRSLELFIEYSVIEGLRRSDQMKILKNEICAQAEILGIAKRSFWAPDVTLDAFGSQRADEWGAGSKGKALFNRTDWIVGLNLSFPLYTGGYKTASKRQACQELERLKLELQDLIDLEKELVRIAAYNAVSSYTAINLSQLSAETAHSNLTLVQGSYSKGIMPIVDLLDAQNQALRSDLVTANAIYDFLIDLVVFQRYVHKFDFLVHPGDVDEWIQGINYFFKLHQKGA